MIIKRTAALLLLVAILASLCVGVFADTDDPTNQDPSKLLNDTSIVKDASDAVADTKKDVEVMGMSIYILIRSAGTVVGLIAGSIAVILYMMAGKNSNKRADVLGGLGHFFIAFGAFFALGWLISLVYKFATGLTGA